MVIGLPKEDQRYKQACTGSDMSLCEALQVASPLLGLSSLLSCDGPCPVVQCASPAGTMRSGQPRHM